MSPSASNSSSPRRFSTSSSTRRASTGPRVLSSSVSSTSSPHAQVGHPFGSATAIQVNRTVSVTIEVLSSSALASHMDVSQYHIPVTTSCYSPTTYEYPSIASEYGTSISYSSQGAYPFTPSATSGSSSSYYGQSSVNGTQGSPSFPSGSSEYHLLSRPLYQQQQGRYSPEFESFSITVRYTDTNPLKENQTSIPGTRSRTSACRN